MSHKRKMVFVEPERLLERKDDISREIELTAFCLFRARNGEIGSALDDWFMAESEVLRPVPVEIGETENEVIVTAAVPRFKLA